MENEKKNIGIIIILAIVILGMGVYIIFDKLNSSNNNEPSKELTVDDSTSCASKEENVSVIVLEPINGIAVVYKGNVYVNLYDSTPVIDRIYGEGKFQKLVETRKNYQEYNFGNLNISTILSTSGTNKWLKLNVSDVKAIYNNNYGQALTSTNVKYGILMKKADNTIAYISISNIIEGNTSVTNLDVSNIKDIVIEDNSGYITYLVDANGNKTDVNNYIK